MTFEISLDRLEGSPQEYVKHSTAILLATKMLSDYQQEKERLVGIGPELYIESWANSFLQPFDKSIENLVVMYFLKMLSKMYDYVRAQKKNE